MKKKMNRVRVGERPNEINGDSIRFWILSREYK